MLTKVLKYIHAGWPDSAEGMTPQISAFHCLRNSLAVYNGVILHGHRAVIPVRLHPAALTALHRAHQGITKMQLTARKQMYWPRMIDDITADVKSCKACMVGRETQRREPLIAYTVPKLAWHTVGTDLFQFRNREFGNRVTYQWFTSLCLPTYHARFTTLNVCGDVVYHPRPVHLFARC